jgi:hypothetical protein
VEAHAGHAAGAIRFLGDAKGSLGDAESSLGDAKSSLGDDESCRYWGACETRTRVAPHSG